MTAQARVGVTKATTDVKPTDPAIKPEVKTATATGDRPQWLPEKFKSPEDMAKAYTELEKKLSAPKDAKPVETPKGPTDDLKIPEKGTATDDAANKAVTAAGLDMPKLQAEFDQAGKLSDASMKALKDVGIGDEIVNAYIAGQKAIAAQIRTEITSVAGGPEGFAQMQAWASQNLPDADRIAVNKALESGTRESVNLAFAAVHAKWVAAVGQDPRGAIRGTTSGGAQESNVFYHMDDVKAAIRDPRYKTSETYRQDVASKLKRSNLK